MMRVAAGLLAVLIVCVGGARAEAPPAVAPGVPAGSGTQPVVIYDAAGNVVSSFGGGSGAAGGSVTPAGTAGTQAMAVQGIPGGVPQNVFPCRYSAALPTLASGDAAMASCDVNGRQIVALAAGSQWVGFVGLNPSSSPTTSVSPATTTGSSLVAKASSGNLFGYHATFGATAGYVALVNATAVPAAGAAIAPIECTPIAANASFRTRQDFPDRYSVGVVLLATTSCTTYTAVTPQLMAAFVL